MNAQPTYLCGHCGRTHSRLDAAKHKPHKRSGKPRCLHKRPDNGLHKALVQRACRWLRGARKCAVVFAEPTMAVAHPPDAIGWPSRGSCEVAECKTTLADLKRERRKGHHRAQMGTLGERRWFIVPPELADAALLFIEQAFPDWGLAVAHPTLVAVRRAAPLCKMDDIARSEERYMLVQAVRRHQIGVRWLGRRYRFERYLDKKRRDQATDSTSEELSQPTDTSTSVGASSPSGSEGAAN